MDLMQPMPYTAFQAMLDDFAPKHWLNYHRGLHLSALADSIIEPSWRPAATSARR